MLSQVHVVNGFSRHICNARMPVHLFMLLLTYKIMVVVKSLSGWLVQCMQHDLGLWQTMKCNAHPSRMAAFWIKTPGCSGIVYEQCKKPGSQHWGLYLPCDLKITLMSIPSQSAMLKTHWERQAINLAVTRPATFHMEKYRTDPHSHSEGHNVYFINTE